MRRHKCFTFSPCQRRANVASLHPIYIFMETPDAHAGIVAVRTAHETSHCQSHSYSFACDSIASRMRNLSAMVFSKCIFLPLRITIVLIRPPNTLTSIWAQFFRVANLEFSLRIRSTQNKTCGKITKILTKYFAKHPKCSAFHICRCEKNRNRMANIWNPALIATCEYDGVYIYCDVMAKIE